MEAITSDTLRKIYPLSKNIERYAEALDKAMQECGIDTAARARAFLAQVGHESAQLNRIEENLNYSAQALRKVFPKYFRTPQEASSYAHHPERIANRVYAGRMGNGSEESGDGWKYRGRGLIQITGRDNYVAMSSLMGKDLTVWPDALLMPLDACRSAALWWKAKGLNALADRLSGAGERKIFVAITKCVNGGLNGLEDRWAIYQRAKKVL
nr:MAG TPA: Chitinase A [Caudoviricetes sp.]